MCSFLRTFLLILSFTAISATAPAMAQSALMTPFLSYLSSHGAKPTRLKAFLAAAQRPPTDTVVDQASPCKNFAVHQTITVWL